MPRRARRQSVWRAAISTAPTRHSSQSDAGVRRRLTCSSCRFSTKSIAPFAGLASGWRRATFRRTSGRGAELRDWVGALADGGWLRACVPGVYGGLRAELDVRTLCLAREGLAYHSAMADFAFAMQGLGSAALALFGNADFKKRYLPMVGAGDAYRHLPSRNARQVPTLRRSRRAPCRDGRCTSSTARKRGYPTPASPICTSCSRGPASGARRG